MFTWLKGRATDRRTAIDLYGTVVAQARAPELFARYGVEDTPEGRTSMIIALLCPLLERLSAEGRAASRLARYITEVFVTDIDDCLREMGVGDLSVPKKVKRAAQAFGERCLAYRKALRSDDPTSGIASELAASVPGLSENGEPARALALRLLELQDKLSAAARNELGAVIASFSAVPGDERLPSH